MSNSSANNSNSIHSDEAVNIADHVTAEQVIGLEVALRNTELSNITPTELDSLIRWIIMNHSSGAAHASDAGVVNTTGTVDNASVEQVSAALRSTVTSPDIPAVTNASIPVGGFTSSTSTVLTDDVTVKVANQESKEHMVGMKEVYKEFRNRPITIRAHSYEADIPTTRLTNSNGTFRNIKMIHFIRHGQGYHNLLADLATQSGVTWKQFESTNNTNDPSLPNNNPYMHPNVLDAPLTELGRKQAQYLHYEMIQNSTPVDCVFVSPHCRTLQTGLIAFRHSTNPITTVPLIAHELLREESGVHVCDQRRTISWQTVEFPQYDFEAYCTSDIDPLFHPERRETKFEVAQRIYEFMEFLSQLDDTNNIAVVSHSGWLHILFNAIVQKDCHPKLKEWFQTGEMRSVEIEFILK